MIEALIVTYNSAGEIAECLTAARVAGIAAAVLDNRSTDGTAEIVAERFPWVRLIRSETNLGFGAGTNELARTSDCEYLLALNPDAILAPDTPSVLRAALDADPLAIASGPRLVYPGGERQPSNQGFPDLRFELAEAVANTRFSQFGTWDGIAHADRVMRWSWSGDGRVEVTEVLWATCWLLRHADIDRHGLFDDRFPLYDEDLDFCRRMRSAGRRFLYVPSTTVVHYGGSSTTSARKRRLTRRARYAYYRRSRGRASAVVYLGMTVGIERALARARRHRAHPPTATGSPPP